MLPLAHPPLPRAISAALCVVALLAGCSSSPPRQAEDKGYDSAPAAEPASRLTQSQANDVTLHAISLVGTPYRWGGNTPESGFDCSGLIGYVYKSSAGISPPRTVAALADWGQAVPAVSLRTGDLVVFTQKGMTNHAGIYVGEGRFVHAPSSGGVVRLDEIASKYWGKQQVNYRRP